MHNYELTVVLDGKATAAKKTAVTKTIEKVIELSTIVFDRDTCLDVLSFKSAKKINKNS